jgi:hypothetical protein
MSCDWSAGLVFLGWFADEIPLLSFPTNFESKPDEIFCSLLEDDRMIYA